MNIDQVRELWLLADAAAPGPWFVGYADDEHFMSAEFVAVKPDAPEGWPHPKEVIAITVLKQPMYAINDESEENSEFIAAARNGVPRLCEAVELRERVVELSRELAACATAHGSGWVSVPFDLIDRLRKQLAMLDAE